MKKILVIEPYFGGSHKQFLTGLEKHLDAEFTFLTLPARKWKMRMQLSAPWFAKCIENMPQKRFDTMLCSTFVDVAVLKAMVAAVKGWQKSCRICTYFHENQFEYPNQISDSSLHQFTAINFTTALVSDGIAFNSQFNYDSFITGSSAYVKKAADMQHNDFLERIEKKAAVLYPGLDFALYADKKKVQNRVPVICWNHRWEHDKNPEEFFQTLFLLRENNIEFAVIILGQSFKNAPKIFDIAKERLKDRIIHCGFAETREQYIDFLHQSDIVVSTASHEFFGISVLEAVRAGCTPVVPNRLSYPELYPEEYLYEDGGLYDKLNDAIAKCNEESGSRSRMNVQRFEWGNVVASYRRWLFET